MAVIVIPDLNSEQFVKLPTTAPTGATVAFGTDLFQRSIPNFQRLNEFSEYNKPSYFQLKNMDQTFSWQIATDLYEAVTFKWVKFDGTEIAATILDSAILDVPGDSYDDEGRLPAVHVVKRQWTFRPNVDLTDEGYYYLYCKFEFDTINFVELISEPYWIKQKHENVVKLAWGHDLNEFKVGWGMAPEFNVLVHGMLTYKGNKMNRTLFRNQMSKLRQLDASEWRVHTLSLGKFGTQLGLAPYLCDKLAKAQKLSRFYVDGQQYLMEDGATFEPTPFGSIYPTSSVDIEMVEYGSKEYRDIFEPLRVPLFTTGTYPYALRQLTLVKTSGTGPTSVDLLAGLPGTVGIALDSTTEAALVGLFNVYASITAGGSVSIIDGTAYYICTETQTYGRQVQQLVSYLKIDYTRAADSYLQYRFLASSSLFWGVIATAASGAIYGTPSKVSLSDSGTVYTDNMTGSGLGAFYFFSTDICDAFEMSGQATSCIVGISGKAPARLKSFKLEDYVIGNLDITFIKPALSFLEGFNMRFGTATTIDMSKFDRVLPTDWQALIYFGITYNNLTSAEVDDFFNNFQAKVAVGFPTTRTFTIDTRLQTGGGTVTSASLASRVLMLSAGHTLLFTP